MPLNKVSTDPIERPEPKPPGEPGPGIKQSEFDQVREDLQRKWEKLELTKVAANRKQLLGGN